MNTTLTTFSFPPAPPPLSPRFDLGVGTRCSFLAPIFFPATKPRVNMLFEIIRRIEVFGKRFHVENIFLMAQMITVVQVTRIGILLQKSLSPFSMRDSRFLPPWLDALYWIEMNVRNKIFQISVVARVPRLVFSLKKRPIALVADVEVHRVRSHEFLHETTNAPGFFLSHKQMKMIRHEAIRAQIDERTTAIEVQHLPRGRTSVVVEVKGVRAVREIQQRLKSFVVSFGSVDYALFRATIIEMIIFTFRQINPLTHTKDDITPSPRGRTSGDGGLYGHLHFDCAHERVGGRRNFFVIGDQIFKVEFDRFSGHRTRFIHRRAIGDAPREHRHSDGVAAGGIGFKHELECLLAHAVSVPSRGILRKGAPIDKGQFLYPELYNPDGSLKAISITAPPRPTTRK